MLMNNRPVQEVVPELVNCGESPENAEGASAEASLVSNACR